MQIPSKCKKVQNTTSIKRYSQLAAIQNKKLKHLFARHTNQEQTNNKQIGYKKIINFSLFINETKKKLVMILLLLLFLLTGNGSEYFSPGLLLYHFQLHIHVDNCLLFFLHGFFCFLVLIS